MTDACLTSKPPELAQLVPLALQSPDLRGLPDRQVAPGLLVLLGPPVRLGTPALPERLGLPAHAASQALPALPALLGQPALKEQLALPAPKVPPVLPDPQVPPALGERQVSKDPPALQAL